MSKDNSNNDAIEQVANFVSDMDSQPYYQAIEEVQSAISNMDTPLDITTAEIDYVLDAAGLGPNTNDYEY